MRDRTSLPSYSCSLIHLPNCYTNGHILFMILSHTLLIKAVKTSHERMHIIISINRIMVQWTTWRQHIYMAKISWVKSHSTTNTHRNIIYLLQHDDEDWKEAHGKRKVMVITWLGENRERIVALSRQPLLVHISQFLSTTWIAYSHPSIGRQPCQHGLEAWCILHKIQ